MRLSLPLEMPSDDSLPGLIHGYVSVKAAKSVFASASPATFSGKPYRASKGDRATASRVAQKAGLTVIGESALGLAVCGSPEAFEELTGGKVVPKERLIRAEGGCQRYVTYLDVVGVRQPEALGAARATSVSARIDGVFLEQPRIPFTVFPSPIAPVSSRYHLRVPDDVAIVLGAKAVHREGIRGDGVEIAMPDTGWYRHPFFSAHHYAIKKPIVVVPGANPAKDPVGHGTGESANIFALAPNAELQPIRVSNDTGDLVGVTAGLLRAKETGARIITNSWGGDGEYPPKGEPDPADMAIAAEIQDAIDNGILVIFSGGNGQFSVEPQVPGVLAVGGVFMTSTREFRASDYASGYKSPWFGGARVPTVSGLVGMLPRAQYLMLPIPPACEIDAQESATTIDDPVPDGTTASDGWALFSGTSAAAPQVAGAAALILSVRPKLKPAQVIEALVRTAMDVTAGVCHPRFANPALRGRDLATGAGLIDAGRAVQYAKAHFSK